MIIHVRDVAGRRTLGTLTNLSHIFELSRRCEVVLDPEKNCGKKLTCRKFNGTYRRYLRKFPTTKRRSEAFLRRDDYGRGIDYQLQDLRG